MKFVTLLRGINMLGHNKLSMEDLSQIHANLGYTNIKTVLNSGNVVFETNQKATIKNIGEIEKNIFDKVSKHMKKPIDIQIIPFSKIEKLVKNNPFEKTPEGHIKYISFIYNAKISKENKTDSIETLPGVLATNIADHTIKMMTILDKEYDKKVTTRN